MAVTSAAPAGARRAAGACWDAYSGTSSPSAKASRGGVLNARSSDAALHRGPGSGHEVDREPQPAYQLLCRLLGHPTQGPPQPNEVAHPMPVLPGTPLRVAANLPHRVTPVNSPPAASAAAISPSTSWPQPPCR